jgi:hypothetical protein
MNNNALTFSKTEYIIEADMLTEGILQKFPILASLGLASALSSTGVDAAAAKSTNPESTKLVTFLSTFKPNIDLNSDKVSIIKQLENSKSFPPGHWNASLNRWFIYDDNGKDAIGYGHDLTEKEKASGKLMTGIPYKNGITDEDAIRLLKLDIAIREKYIKTFIPTFDKLPTSVKNALLVAVYRGDIKKTHNTTKLINSNNFKSAAVEFLNNKNFKTGNSGIRMRMLAIAKSFFDYGNTTNQSAKTSVAKSKPVSENFILHES